MTHDNPSPGIFGKSLDDQFLILLHKKIMNKTGSSKRRSKKYYIDQYQKTGLIPTPLLLAGKGIMEGRKCSGRPSALAPKVRERFIEMVRASVDPAGKGFIFITRKARTVKNYHLWLEEEFNHPISISALRRCVNAENLKQYIEKPDFNEKKGLPMHCFNAEPVFSLIQVDGCTFRYLKIRDKSGGWKKPQVIEFYDTGSRYMCVLDFYFSESNQNAVELFTRFLLSTSFPEKTIRIRPDNAKGFLNLKRSINALNLRHSLPGGFYMEPDFSRIRAPKDKVHLESSHRSLHNFEIRIIKAFEDRIFKTEPGYVFKNGKREKITITLLDIGLEELRNSGIIEIYRREHNSSKHYFSENGRTTAWVPEQKLETWLAEADTVVFSSADVKEFAKYGFARIKATVSNRGTVTLGNRKYYVAEGTENFSRYKGTPVYVSHCEDKLFIFEYKDEGLLLGEALAQKPFDRPVYPPDNKIEVSEVERIEMFLEKQGMVIERRPLIEKKKNGLTLDVAKEVYRRNRGRYRRFLLKLNQPPEMKGAAMFNAFLLDCEKQQRKTHVAPYASCGEE
jgi:hypothetical protein